MNDVLILVGVAIVSSFVATFRIASRLRRVEPLSEVEHMRIQLDAQLDELELSELHEVSRLCRDLERRQVSESAQTPAVGLALQAQSPSL